jgi:ADP-ribose pyrophosphatase YjhB (NUDIX family)
MSRFPVLGVGAVIWNAKREIVLIRRGRAPRENQWSIPGGHVEWGESVQDALLREIREETGLSVEIKGLIDAVDLLTRDAAGDVIRHYVLIDFAAQLIGGDLRAGSDALEARWVSYSQLGDYALWSETRRIIDASLRLTESSGEEISPLK